MKEYKVHYIRFQFQVKMFGDTLCRNRYEQALTKDAKEVTCEKCIERLKKQGLL